MGKMKIEIWSDIACPYCYIGKRKLEKALQQFEHADKIDIKWRSYQLDPSLQKGKTDISYIQNISDKTGRSLADIEKSIKRIEDIASTVGLKYDFEKIIITNTSDALRLVKLAAQNGLASEMEEALFSAYFIEGKCVSDPEVLISIGTKMGLDEKRINIMLKSEEFKDSLISEKEDVKLKYELHYIPFYLINKSHILQGSIEVQTYIDTIREAYKEWEKGTKSEGSSYSGQACSIDGSGCS